MRLDMIGEGHWQVAPIAYPNSLVRPTKGRMSFLLHPRDRDRFFKTKKRKNNTHKK